MHVTRFLLPVLLAFQVGVSPALAWTWPVDGPVLRPFAFEARTPYAGGQHRGIDIGAPLGAAVRAPASGTVTFAGTVPTGGKTVAIATGDGYSVTLVHLGSIAVAPGRQVVEGDTVGTVGPSGEPEIAGSYVHLGIRHALDEHGYLDPLGFLPARPGPLPPEEFAEKPARAPVANVRHAQGERDSKARRASTPTAKTPTSSARSSPSGAGERQGARERARPRLRGERRSVGPPRMTNRSPGAASRRGRREGLAGTGVAHAAPAAEPVLDEGKPSSVGLAALAALAGLGALAALMRLRVRRQVGDAGSADGATAMLVERGGAAAEDAGRLRPREEDRLLFDRDLERVLLAQPEALANLDRDDDAAELVDVADDPRALRFPSDPGRSRVPRCSRFQFPDFPARLGVGPASRVSPLSLRSETRK